MGKVGKTVGLNFMHFYNNYINIVKPTDIVANIADKPIQTEKQVRSAANELSVITSEIEVIAAKELANKLYDSRGKDGVTDSVILTYLVSLNLEVAVSIFLEWKDSDDEALRKFYIFDLIKIQPNKWFIKQIMKKVF